MTQNQDMTAIYASARNVVELIGRVNETVAQHRVRNIDRCLLELEVLNDLLEDLRQRARDDIAPPRSAAWMKPKP